MIRLKKILELLSEKSQTFFPMSLRKFILKENVQSFTSVIQFITEIKEHVHFINRI